MRRLVMPLEPAARSSGTRRVVTLPNTASTRNALEPWIAAVSAAHAPCLIADGRCAVVAMSPAAATMLSTTPDTATGRLVLDVFRVVDFRTGAPTTEYTIPPLAALASSAHSRAVIRLAGPSAHITVDAVAAPLYDDDGSVIASLTFLAALDGRAPAAG